jgi:hypothetical protein
MNSGKYIFSQLLDFVNRYKFKKTVKKYNWNYRVRELNCWNQFIQLFFGKRTNLNALLDFGLCLKAHNNKLYHLGIKNYVSHTTLSRANEKRDCHIFSDFGNHLIELIRFLYINSEVPNLSIDNELYAIDEYSTPNCTTYSNPNCTTYSGVKCTTHSGANCTTYSGAKCTAHSDAKCTTF